MSVDEGSGSSRHTPLLVLGKITEILDAFSLARPALTFSEIQQATGLPTSTVQRLVTNMVAQGLLDRVGDQIRIGVRMAYWAAPAVKGVDVLTIVNPVLREMRDTRHVLRRDMYVGKILPLHAGSAGRVLLAWNPELAEAVLARPLEPITDTTVTSPELLRELIRQTRSDGFAITTAEREDGSSGLSAPVFNSAAELVGALSISGPTIRMPLATCEEWVDLLVGSAEKLTRTLGGRFPS
jgi:DNA-binding IclR family transcriptional regulator